MTVMQRDARTPSRQERREPVVGRLWSHLERRGDKPRTKRGIDMAKKIYVGNMNYNTSEDTLRQLFAQYGEVVSVNVITDRYTGRAKGFGFVEMASEDAARAAMTALNGKEVDGRQLKVNEANDKPRDSNRSGGGGGGSREPVLLKAICGEAPSGAVWLGLPSRFRPLSKKVIHPCACLPGGAAWRGRTTWEDRHTRARSAARSSPA